MLHRLAELDEVVRAGYDAFEFKRITRALIDFMVVELSAFYFDIRKDALYCDAPSSLRRKAAVEVVRHLFDCLVTWLAPMLPFTMEEAWLDRHPGRAVSVHLEQFPRSRPTGRTRRWPKNGARCGRSAASSPARWRSSGRRRRSARRWRRRPVVHITDPELRAALDGLDLAEIAITSEITVSAGEAPAGAFALDDVRGVGVVAGPCQRHEMRALLALHRMMSARTRSTPMFRRATRPPCANWRRSAACDDPA